MTTKARTEKLTTIDIPLAGGRCIRLSLTSDLLELRSGWLDPFRGDPWRRVDLPASHLGELIAALSTLNGDPK